jgi:hypothetical protein
MIQVLAVIVPFAACGDPGAFVCERDDQCSGAGGAGTCEAGCCAFPDPDCPSGKRCGAFSGEHADQCVPVDGTGTEAAGSSTDNGPSGSSGSEATTGGGTLPVSADASAGETSSGATVTGTATTTGDRDPTEATSDSGGLEDAVGNYVFVTSTARTVSTFGGLAGADAWCNELATDAALPGDYVAWLSTVDVNAIDRLGGAEGWARVDGLPFARSVNAIVSAEHLFPIRLDEQGQDRLGANVVTATAADGTYFGPTDCDGWTSAVGDARRGSSDALGDVFTTSFDGSCDASLRIYCFGVDDAVDLEINLPPAGRRAFVTVDSLPASAGLAAFDEQCQSEADMAGLAGTFSALVSTPATSASDRFDLMGEPWSLLNDVPVVETAADLGQQNATLLAPIWLSASGIDEGGGAVWQGSTEPATAAMDATSCAGWAATTGAALAGSRARSVVWWGNQDVPCTNSRRVLCLEN